MISELSGQIGTYVADLIGTDIKLHGNTLSDGMRNTIGTLYQAERVPNAPAPAGKQAFDNTPKPAIPSLDI